MSSIKFIHRINRHINYKFIYFCYRDTRYKKKVFETKKIKNNYIEVKQRRIKTNHERFNRSKKHSRSKNVFCRIKNKSDIEKTFLKKTSNIESIRKFLNIVLNKKNLNTMIKKLKKFKRDVVYEIVYCMKKQLKNSVDEKNFLLENDHKLKKKKKNVEK